jgi:hypothetical protein
VFGLYCVLSYLSGCWCFWIAFSRVFLGMSCPWMSSLLAGSLKFSIDYGSLDYGLRFHSFKGSVEK